MMSLRTSLDDLIYYIFQPIDEKKEKKEKNTLARNFTQSAVKTILRLFIGRFFFNEIMDLILLFNKQNLLRKNNSI